MNRLFLLFALLLAAWAGPARAAGGIPPRPKPFTFVTDQAGLLQPADAKKLESGLRRYADNTGTQLVVVTVPSLGGQNVNEFARQLGTAWGVGQQGKDNGLVVLVSSQDHKLSIEPGRGLRGTITPAVIQRTIGQMTPSFKQNNYFAGLRQGLNTLMVTANPGSAPASASPAASSNSVASDNTTNADATSNAAPLNAQPTSDPVTSNEAAPSSGGGIGFGTILIGLVVVGGGIWLVSRLFRRNSNTAGNGGGQTTFYPNQPGQGNAPNFYPNQGQPGYGYGTPQSSGPGIGGMLATGAAAAAGAYLGNRMADSGHDSGSSSNFSGSDSNANYGNAGAAGGNAAGDYFNSRNDSDSGSSGSSPDYFSDNSSSDNSGDYFSGNDNSYDDSSGGGGFDDSSSDNSGSW